MAPKVTVIGSVNTDLVIKAPKLPDPGETILGGSFAVIPGGKGANQAVAAARLGAQVIMLGSVGDDTFGERLRAGLAADGIDVAPVRVARGVASGVALITVDQQGRNTIVVASGANMQLTIADVDAVEDAISTSQVVMLQLEVPLDVVVHAAQLARSKGVTVVLDPAPARPLPPTLYQSVSVIHPNELEAQILTGVPVPDEHGARLAAARLLQMGCSAAIIKLGARGVFVATASSAESVPGIPVDVVDTTAAGDAFAGALAVALGESRTLSEAARFANVVAALKVTRLGAQPSMPTRNDVVAFARTRGIAT